MTAIRFTLQHLFKACLLLALLGIALNSRAGETLYFTAIPDQDAAQLQTRFDAIADYLSNTLQIEAIYLPVKSYAAAVTAFKNNQVQLAWFGGLSGVRARALVPGSRAIAQGYEDQFFQSHFIAHRDTGLSLSDDFPAGLAGLSFTFGAKGSTSGRLMPEFYIRKHTGKSPDELFSRVGFSGDHSRTIELVQSGAYQLGAVNYKVWEQQLAEGKVDTQLVRVIWTTPNYPDYQWSIRGDLDQRFGAGFSTRVQDALLGMKDPELLKRFPRQSFVPASNADYEPIVSTATALGLMEEE